MKATLPARPLHPRIAEYLSGLELGSFALTRGRASEEIAGPHWPANEGGKVARLVDEAAGERYDIQFDQKAIARVTIDLDRMVVAKEIGRYAEHGIHERELHWLERLRGSGIVPDMLSHPPRTILMSYVGEPVRQYNLPADWPAQADFILTRLKEHGCCHNDIKCDNLTVLRGRLYLVDFGWATRIGEPIPATWPTGIGRQHRLGIHRFDDRHAIHAALESAARDAVDRSIVMPQ